MAQGTSDHSPNRAQRDGSTEDQRRREREQLGDTRTYRRRDPSDRIPKVDADTTPTEPPSPHVEKTVVLNRDEIRRAAEREALESGTRAEAGNTAQMPLSELDRVRSQHISESGRDASHASRASSRGAERPRVMRPGESRQAQAQRPQRQRPQQARSGRPVAPQAQAQQRSRAAAHGQRPHAAQQRQAPQNARRQSQAAYGSRQRVRPAQQPQQAVRQAQPAHQGQHSRRQAQTRTASQGRQRQPQRGTSQRRPDQYGRQVRPAQAQRQGQRHAQGAPQRHAAPQGRAPQQQPARRQVQGRQQQSPQRRRPQPQPAAPRRKRFPLVAVIAAAVIALVAVIAIVRCNDARVAADQAAQQAQQEQNATQQEQVKPTEIAGLSEGTYYIEPYDTENGVLAFDVSGVGDDAYTTVVVNELTQTVDQQIQLTISDDGSACTLTNGDLYLDAGDVSAGSGRSLFANKSDGGDTQRWKLTENSDGTYSIVSAADDTLAMAVVSAYDSAPVTVEETDSTDSAQRFRIIARSRVETSVSANANAS